MCRLKHQNLNGAWMLWSKMFAFWAATYRNGFSINVVTTKESQDLENSQTLSFGLLNVLVNWLITNICLYGTIHRNISNLTQWCFKHLDYWSRSLSALFSWSCFILSFSGLLQSSLETSILGHLPLFPKLLCGFIMSTAFPPVCTPSEEEHSVPFSSVWAFCFHVLTRKPAHSCAKTERNTEVWTHYRNFHPSKELGLWTLYWTLQEAEVRPWLSRAAQLSCCWDWLNMLCPDVSPFFLGSGRGQAGFIKLNNTQGQKAIKESSQHLKIIEPGPKPCPVVNIDVPSTMKGRWILRKKRGNNLRKSFYSCSLWGLVVVSFYQPGGENWNKVLDYSWN